MLPGNKYQLVDGGLLSREPDAVGSTEWWQWWREACNRKNPYRAGSAEARLWKQRVQTNPFRQNTAEWYRWRRGCCPFDESSAEGLLEREPIFVGTEEWWDWWLRLPAASATPTQPNSAQLVQQVDAPASRPTPFPIEQRSSGAAGARAAARPPPPADFPVVGLLRPAVFLVRSSPCSAGPARSVVAECATTTAST